MTEEIKFEKALERLEKIVEDLETGNITLDEALKKYEEGVKLSRECQKKLNEAEKKIEILTKSLDGSMKKEPFEIPEENEREAQAESAKKGRKPAIKEAGDEEEDLLF